MGYSGLIYAAIVAAWAAFLAPRWVRRNEEVEQAREADAIRGVRVLKRPPASPIHAQHGKAPAVATPAARRGVAARTDKDAARRDGDRPARRTPEARELSEAFAVAARRRRQVLSVLMLSLVAAFVAAVLGSLPTWAPAVPAAFVAVFLLLARRAAVTQARRLRDAQRRAATVRRRTSEPTPAVDDTPEASSSAGRRLVIPEAAAVADDGESWEPVPVPLPTYLSKPAAPRAARKIDLSQAGSWTSGRLDAANSIKLPRREPARAAETDEEAAEAAAETSTEHRRAVGD